MNKKSAKKDGVYDAPRYSKRNKRNKSTSNSSIIGRLRSNNTFRIWRPAENLAAFLCLNREVAPMQLV